MRTSFAAATSVRLRVDTGQYAVAAPIQEKRLVAAATSQCGGGTADDGSSSWTQAIQSQRPRLVNREMPDNKNPVPFRVRGGYWWPTRPNKLDQ